jgi:type VI secretion system protein VasD
MIIIRKIILLSLILLTFTACTTPPVEMNFISMPNINPDHKHRSLPVVIRVYELTQKEPFLSATFHQLWHEDKSMLGNTYINRQEWIINPNSNITVHFQAQPQASYIGIIALFRNPDQKHWRVIKAIPGHIAAVLNHMSIQLVNNTIKIANTVSQVK